MRLTLLATAGVLAASIGLSACSSGGSQAIPGGSQATSPMANHSLHIVAVNPQPDAACPSTFFLCVTLKGTKALKNEVCLSSASPPSCSSPAPGVWTWTGKAAVVKTGKPFKTISGKYKPNPGNPTNLTLKSSKVLKSTKGKYIYEWNLTACNSASSCVSGSIGIAIK